MLWPVQPVSVSHKDPELQKDPLALRMTFGPTVRWVITEVDASSYVPLAPSFHHARLADGTGTGLIGDVIKYRIL